MFCFLFAYHNIIQSIINALQIDYLLMLFPYCFSTMFIGVSIVSVSATDADDSPDNRRIEFSIIGGDPLGVFSMQNQEPNTGRSNINHALL